MGLFKKLRKFFSSSSHSENSRFWYVCQPHSYSEEADATEALWKAMTGSLKNDVVLISYCPENNWFTYTTVNKLRKLAL